MGLTPRDPRGHDCQATEVTIDVREDADPPDIVLPSGLDAYHPGLLRPSVSGCTNDAVWLQRSHRLV